MLRTVLGIFVGLVCGVLIIAGWEGFVHKIFPRPGNLNFADKEAVNALMQQMPLSAYWLILVGYVFAAFGGGAVATAIHQLKKILPAMVVAGLLMLAAAANFVMLPHPMWFIVASMIVYPMFAFIGAAMVLRAKR